MKELTKKELIQVNGGLSISGSLINSIAKGLTVFLDLGRSLGTAIRRIGTSSICPL
jgi:bacteriocin-like protein